GAGYEHFWVPNVSTTLYSTYSQTRYNNAVIESRGFCTGQNISVSGTCDPGFNLWIIGTHTDWYPVAGFPLAVEVNCTRVGTAFDGQTVSLAKSVGLRPTGSYTAKDQGIIAVGFRAVRSFATGGE